MIIRENSQVIKRDTISIFMKIFVDCLIQKQQKISKHVIENEITPLNRITDLRDVRPMLRTNTLECDHCN